MIVIVIVRVSCRHKFATLSMQHAIQVYQDSWGMGREPRTAQMAPPVVAVDHNEVYTYRRAYDDVQESVATHERRAAELKLHAVKTALRNPANFSWTSRWGIEFIHFGGHPLACVAPSGVHGRGLFADRDFEKNDIIACYTGVQIAPYHLHDKHNPDSMLYVISLDGRELGSNFKYDEWSQLEIPSSTGGTTTMRDEGAAYMRLRFDDTGKVIAEPSTYVAVDGENERTGGAQFMNHAVECNVILYEDGLCIAKRDISRFEELVFDYGPTYSLKGGSAGGAEGGGGDAGGGIRVVLKRRRVIDDDDDGESVDTELA